MLANNVTDWSQWVRHSAKRFPDVSGEMLISHREMGPFSEYPCSSSMYKVIHHVLPLIFVATR